MVIFWGSLMLMSPSLSLNVMPTPGEPSTRKENALSWASASRTTHDMLALTVNMDGYPLTHK